ncbi:morn repeat protein [Planoprotostelium fungivorum]|uniref:Morn repeat protein n=1 Tax=Planoprotostelium fungivorum TaxID=1890364 RepID=A0A2P6ND09_9EUKA|nr:morn repeat protein [Planoprotostelium fungivorum]
MNKRSKPDFDKENDSSYVNHLSPRPSDDYKWLSTLWTPVSKRQRTSPSSVGRMLQFYSPDAKTPTIKRTVSPAGLDISCLPPEMLAHVFRFLGYDDWLRCTYVCQYWSELVLSECDIPDFHGFSAHSIPPSLHFSVPIGRLLLLLSATDNRRDTMMDRAEDIISIGEKSSQRGYRYLNGTAYSGRWRNGRRNGFGLFIYQSGMVYLGGWLDDQKHGKGVVLSPNGSYYTGYWELDERILKPNLVLMYDECTPIRYVIACGDGEYLYDEPMECQKRSIYNAMVESFEDALDPRSDRQIPLNFQQPSIVKYRHGIYEGNLIGGRRHGWGAICWNRELSKKVNLPSNVEPVKREDMIYMGQWVMGQIEGFGLCFYPDHTVYKGNWFDGCTDGSGTMYFPATSQKRSGTWRRGVHCHEAYTRNESSEEDTIAAEMCSDVEFSYSSLKQYTRSDYPHY